MGMGPVSILAVSPAGEDNVLLDHVFSHSNWKFDRVRTCREALEYLKRTEISVIICAADLPDGDWKHLLDQLKGQLVPPRVIVESQIADDRLWAEVLDSGGYDVLAKPFEQREVIRVVSLAWRQWKHESELVVRDAIAPDAKTAGE
jgi:DNA-binding response OmpR family regulator